MEVTKYKFVQLCQSNHSECVLMALCEDETFVDITLTAEGHSVKAHKSVLAAVSPYFKSVLSDNPCQHPVIIMPHNVLIADLLNIIDYIYKGEVSVDISQIPSLLQTAEILQISGLIGAEDCTLSSNYDASSDAKPHTATKYIPPTKQERSQISCSRTTFKPAKNLPLEGSNQKMGASSDYSSSCQPNVGSMPSTKENTFIHMNHQRVPTSLSKSAKRVLQKYSHRKDNLTSKKSSLNMNLIHPTVINTNVDYHKGDESKPRIGKHKTFSLLKNALQNDGEPKITLKSKSSSSSMSPLNPAVFSTIDSFQKGDENSQKNTGSFLQKPTSSSPLGKRRRKMPSNLKDYITEMDIMRAIVNSPGGVDSHVFSTSSSTAIKSGAKTSIESPTSNTVMTDSGEFLPEEMVYIKEEELDIEDVPLA